MGNKKKMDIEITDEEFMGKTQKEQNLIVFKKLCDVDDRGCRWGKENISKRNKKLYALGAGSGFLGGFSAILTKLTIWK